MSTQTFAAKAVTQGPKHHFFGYYGICPWNATGQYLLCLESEFHERPPAAEDSAVVGLVELATGKFEPLAETRAWNLQQGCMLHWLPTAPEREIVYNDRQGDRHVAVVMDIHTGKKRVLPRAVSGLNPVIRRKEAGMQTVPNFPQLGGDEYGTRADHIAAWRCDARRCLNGGLH